LKKVVASVEEAIKTDDAEKIKEEVNKVYPAMKSLLEAKQAAEQAKQEGSSKPDEDVVEATFTQTKDK